MSIIPNNTRRVVITGMGVISPIGLDVASFHESLNNGVIGIKPCANPAVANYKVGVSAHIDNFDPLKYFDRKEARRMDRYCQFALAAAREAVAQANGLMNAYAPERVGTIIGSGVGGLETIDNEYKKLLLQGGPGRVSPLFIPMMIANMAAGHVSMAFGTKGASYCVTTACASGTHAIGEAFRAIKHGYLDACIAGGTEAPITSIALAGFANMTALTSEKDPTRASIPFDRQRSGFVIGEGAGALILEELDHARARGARIYAEVIGSGLTADAYHITAPHPDGMGAVNVMKQAINESGLKPSDVDYINVHGTATPLGDIAEIKAILALFGEHAYKLNISATKSMTGHLLGAAGVVEAIATTMAVVHDIIPPTINFRNPDPAIDQNLNLTLNKAQQRTVNVALSNNFGFGGHNASILIRKFKE